MEICDVVQMNLFYFQTIRAVQQLLLLITLIAWSESNQLRVLMHFDKMRTTSVG